MFAWDSGGRAYAGSDDSGGLWGSDDDGRTWRLLTGAHANTSAMVIEIVQHPDAETIYVGDYYARHPLLISRDRGQTWEVRGTALPSQSARRVASIAVDPANPSRIVVGTGHDGGHPGDGLYLSEDGGHRWRQVAFAGCDVPDLVRLADGRLFAAVHAEGRQAPVGLVTSRDGVEWKTVPDFDGVGVSSIDIGPDGSLLVGALRPEASIWRSVDGGASWTGHGLAGHPVWRVLEDPAGGLVAGGPVGTGVQRSDDGGSSWTRASGVPSPAVIGLGRSPHTGTWLCSTFANVGIFRSEDGARSFAPSSQGLAATFVTDLCCAGDRHLVAALLGTYEVVPDSNVCAAAVSQDGGLSWAYAEGVPAHGLAVAADPQDPTQVLLGTFRRGIWLSRDGGRSYAALGGDEVVSTVHFTGAGEALAAVIELAPDAPPAARVTRSADGGATWETVAENVAVARFASAGPLVLAAASGGILRSADRGVSWALVQDGAFQSVAIDAGEPGHAVAGAEGTSVWLSDDGGETWRERILPGVDPAATRGVRRVLRRGRQVVAGLSGAEDGVDVDGGLLISEDDGETWARCEDGLTTNHVWGLEQDSTGALFAATYAGGVFRWQPG